MTIEEANQYVERTTRIFAEIQKLLVPPEEDQAALADLAAFFTIQAKSQDAEINQDMLNAPTVYLVTAYKLGTNRDWEAGQE